MNVVNHLRKWQICCVNAISNALYSWQLQMIECIPRHEKNDSIVGKYSYKELTRVINGQMLQKDHMTSLVGLQFDLLPIRLLPDFLPLNYMDKKFNPISKFVKVNFMLLTFYYANNN